MASLKAYKAFRPQKYVIVKENVINNGLIGRWLMTNQSGAFIRRHDPGSHNKMVYANDADVTSAPLFAPFWIGQFPGWMCIVCQERMGKVDSASRKL